MKLKPCPFCGKTAQAICDERLGFRVVCNAYKACGATGPLRHSHERAEKAWNRREGVRDE